MKLFISFILIALQLEGYIFLPATNKLSLLHEGSGKEYYISLEATDLETAKQTCQAIPRKKEFSLLSIENEKEYTVILMSLLKIENVRGIWTSGYYSPSNSNYFWSNTKQAMGYTNFYDVTKQGKNRLTKSKRASDNNEVRPCPSDCQFQQSSGSTSLELKGKRSSSRVRRCGGPPICEAEPCEPLELLPCNTTRPDCTVKCTPKCKTFRPPCSVKCPPCNITTPPCTVGPSKCDVVEKECTTETEPCEVITPPCVTTRPPCITEQPNCVITTPTPCTTPPTPKPCSFVSCEDTQPPCLITQPPCVTTTPPCYTSKKPCFTEKPKCTKISPGQLGKNKKRGSFYVNSTMVCEPGGLICPPDEVICPAPFEKCESVVTCPPPITTCKPSVTCLPAKLCQSPAIICPSPITICPPPVTTCKEPTIICPEPVTTCDPPEVNCTKPEAICPPAVIICPSPIVTCPSPVTTCDPPDVECPKPIVDCPEIKPNCPPPKQCTIPPPCTTEATTTQMTTAPTTTTKPPCHCCNCTVAAVGSNPTQDLQSSDSTSVSGFIILNYSHNFKWDIEPNSKKMYHFICEGEK